MGIQEQGQRLCKEYSPGAVILRSKTAHAVCRPYPYVPACESAEYSQRILRILCKGVLKHRGACTELCLQQAVYIQERQRG